MKRILSLILLLISSSNALWEYKTPRYTPIKKITDPDYCYTRKIARDNVTNYDERSNVQYFCKNTYKESASSSYIKSDTCSGSKSIVFHEKAWFINLKLCSSIDLTKDLDGKDIVYYGGIPYDKTSVTNGLYYNPYDGVLICNKSYLQINNDSCIKPDYNKRNLADAILKRDKIARDNNLTDVSGINPNSITYNETTGAIESFSFSAINAEGNASVIATTFEDSDPVFTVEDDGTIKEEAYDPNVHGNDSGNTGGNSGGSSSGGDTGNNSGNDGNSGGGSAVDSNKIALAEMNASLKNIDDALNADIPNVENSLKDASSFYDDTVIPEVEELVRNFTTDFNSLKNNYTDKIAYIKENGFTFNYQSKLYETCPLNYELTVLENPMEINFDICKLMAEATLPKLNTSIQVIFFTIFYTFFYAVILLGIFRLAILTFRSF